eukprot:TRINITY_DN944_c0_g1::TRINITY_DN944_c0_g1_i1::g.16076::m.16076 TRINITY_DN944_c0_g1::TRINITY_DN944_c0_g1_i1::g.16076  ORF type:complete len:212 (+),score=43.83,sp/Q9SKI2/VPS2A_ARATH/58.64/7e-78,Snf7/PF03357.16/1.3e-43,Snf7/PF03357.16/4.8e+03,Ist1/PF03398.9/0.019,Mitofilin/PF09731.4/0.052,DUF29/PF01724.11/1.5,DUF29/PF01724.11/1.2e+02,DUF29/PF01724.11/1.7e+02,DUF939_C/PF11728.3/0.39,DUF939_C/PF11728.3/2e+02,TFIID_20kDa/PF03847.8/0.2,YlqD/PF11068.3/0.18,YlqD/PF11068.3/1.8e+02,Fib_alpha/PF08702.5/3.5,
MFLFGKKKTPQELMREYKRGIDKAIRELDRERTQLQNQEKKCINDIKKMAKQGQMGAVKIMAKDLVRTRRYITKFYKMRTQLQAVGLKLQTMKSTQAMTDAMKGASKAMHAMNKQLNLPKMQQIMQEFERENEITESKEEMMNDVMDDVMDDAGDEAETDEIVQQVLDEIGIGLNSELASAPAGPVAAPEAEKEAEPVDDLQARLDNLKRT